MVLVAVTAEEVVTGEAVEAAAVAIRVPVTKEKGAVVAVVVEAAPVGELTARVRLSRRTSD